MTADAWGEATFDGSAAARARRIARLTPQQRLDWLEAALQDAARSGVLVAVRRRRHRSVLAAWGRHVFVDADEPVSPGRMRPVS
jgi:hypothetical protein